MSKCVDGIVSMCGICFKIQTNVIIIKKIGIKYFYNEIKERNKKDNMNKPIALGKEEETLISPKIDLVTLQRANTALGNRLDNYKRQLVKAAEIEQKCLAISESYDYFFASFFSGWNNFLIKFERINLLMKEQDNTDKTSMFRLIFDNIRDMA